MLTLPRRSRSASFSQADLLESEKKSLVAITDCDFPELYDGPNTARFVVEIPRFVLHAHETAIHSWKLVGLHRYLNVYVWQRHSKSAASDSIGGVLGDHDRDRSYS